MTIQLEKIDSGKINDKLCDHAGIIGSIIYRKGTASTYLAKVDGNWYCGRFIIEGTRGLTFVGSEGHHHFNPTKCEELYEIKE